MAIVPAAKLPRVESKLELRTRVQKRSSQRCRLAVIGRQCVVWRVETSHDSRAASSEEDEPLRRKETSRRFQPEIEHAQLPLESASPRTHAGTNNANFAASLCKDLCITASLSRLSLLWKGVVKWTLLHRSRAGDSFPSDSETIEGRPYYGCREYQP